MILKVLRKTISINLRIRVTVSQNSQEGI